MEVSNKNPVKSDNQVCTTSPNNNDDEEEDRPMITVRRPVYTQQALTQSCGLGHKDHEAAAGDRPTLARRCRRLVARGLRQCCCDDAGGEESADQTGSRCRRLAVRWFPVVGHLATYRWREWIANDVIAGISSGAVHVPQSMGFAMLAGLPPVYGLYSSIVPGWVYYVFGTSRHISIGTMVLTALMVGAVVDRHSHLNSPSPPPPGRGGQLENVTESPWTDAVDVSAGGAPLNETLHEDVEQFKVGVATSVTLMCGLVLLLMRFCRLSVVTDYMSLPLVNAFIAAAALASIISQVPFLLGITIVRTAGWFQTPLTVVAIIRQVAHTNLCALVVSTLCIVFLLVVKEGVNERCKRRLRVPVPGELIIIIVTTAVSYLAGLNERYSLPVVGHIPSGLPSARLPPITRPVDYLGDAVLLAVVVYAMSISMAKMMAARNRYEIDTEQELFAYGLHNVIPAFFGCFASTQAPPRTLINESCRCHTQLAGLVSTGVPLLVVLVLGPLFHQLPNCVLGAVVTSALVPLLRRWPGQVRAVWPVSGSDVIVAVITFTATTVVSIASGLLIGVGVSVLTFLLHAQRARLDRLAAAGNTDIYLPTSASVVGRDRVAVFRFGAAIFFANADSFRRQLYAAAATSKLPDVDTPEVEKRLEDGDAGTGNSANHVDDNAGYQRADEKAGELQLVLSHEDASKDPELISTWPPVGSSRRVVLDCSAVSYVDAMGVAAIQHAARELDDVRVQLVLAGCCDDVTRRLAAASAADGKDRRIDWTKRTYPTVHDAVSDRLL